MFGNKIFVTKRQVEKIDCSEQVFDNLLNAVKKIDYDTTQIFLGNPTDLLKMDMDKFSVYCCFISVSHIKRGKLLLVKDGKVKEELCKFAKNNPDRVFRGRGGI